MDSSKQDLLKPDEAAKVLTADYPPASVRVYNDLPPYYDISIVQYGCKFIYDDGHNDNKAKNVNIPAGGQDVLFASYSGCCRSYFVIMRARARDGKEWNFANSATVDAGYCGAELRWHLVPERQISKAQSGETARFALVLERS